MPDPILFQGTPGQVDEFLTRLEEPVETPKLEELFARPAVFDKEFKL